MLIDDLSTATRKAQQLVIRRILAIVLIVLGLTTAGVGVALGTIWRANDTVTATLPQDPEVPVVVAGGNVLATVNPEVTITVTAQDPDTDLVLAMGRESDVRAWLGDASYLEVTGLTDWNTLAVEQGTAKDPKASEDPSASGSEETTDAATEDSTEGSSEAEGEVANPVPNPAGSDLWIEQVTGTGELTYDWNRVDGRWMMLVASDGTHPAPTVSMTWTRNVSTPLVLPLIIAGAVVFLIGLVWLIIEMLVLREERRARLAAESGVDDAPAVPTTDADGNPLTRRQIREAARAAGRPGATPPAEVPSEPSPASADAAEPHADADEPGESTDASGADDLAAWVSATTGTGDSDETDRQWQGAEASDEPADAQDDESGAEEATTGADTDEAQDGATRGADDQAGSTEPAAADSDEHETAPPAAGGLRGRLRRRRRRRSSPDPVESEQGPAPATERLHLGSPHGQSQQSGRTGGEEHDDPDANPQASGASWRATWGLGSISERDEDQEEDR